MIEIELTSDNTMSPDSFSAPALLSTTTIEFFMSSLSISLQSGRQAPTPTKTMTTQFENLQSLPHTMAPSLTHLPQRTGSVDMVTVTTTSAPLQASSNLSYATQPLPISLAHCLALSALRPHTLICENGRVFVFCVLC